MYKTTYIFHLTLYIIDWVGSQSFCKLTETSQKHISIFHNLGSPLSYHTWIFDLMSSRNMWGLPGVPKVHCSEGSLFRRFVGPNRTLVLHSCLLLIPFLAIGTEQTFALSLAYIDKTTG